jgi:integrase
MPRHSKVNVREAAARSNRENKEAVVREMFDGAVQPQTLVQYERQFQTAEEFRVLTHHNSWDPALILVWWKRLEEAGYASLEGWRCAIRHGLLARARFQEAEYFNSDMVIKASKGVGFRAQMGRKPPGKMNLGMFQGFLRWLHKKKAAREIEASIILFGAALRIGELRGLRVGDVQEDTETLASLFIRRNKAKTHRHPKRSREFVKPISVELADFIRKLGAGRRHGELLFPNGRELEATIRRSVHRAAVDLGWPSHLDYRGPHVFRHAGVLLLEEKIFPFRSIKPVVAQ